MGNNNETLSQIRKDFYVFRNGTVAESLKNLYPSSILIFGLNVPQFMELATKYPKDKELAKLLWEDISCRESRLLSLYILPPTEVDLELASKMIEEVRSMEEAEFLSFRILRHLSFAKELSKKYDDSIDSLSSFSIHALNMLKKALS